MSGIFSIIRRGRFRPPSFFASPGKDDMAAILSQSTGRRFDPALILGTAARCSFELPSVIACAPLRGGEPFPTTFWLTCPHLVKLCGSLESKGAVARLDKRAREDWSRWTRYHLLHGQIRLLQVNPSATAFLRKYRKPVWDVLRKGGAGGVNYQSPQGRGVKCLHLQAASWLALGFHPAADFLGKALRPLYCEKPPAECAPYIKNRKETFHVEG